ncbi:MAG: PssE/Cps14G family polysaccharide biosynthesis glycosyltransferase [Candidatus Thorarchaeota archaeon]|jgi:UDP-N-acetylglucosamine transferase subunit ALG13
MIFLTVGTASFDLLVQKMDHLIGAGIIKDRVIAQIGRGSYLPKNMEYFRFIKSLNKAYEKANLIVSAGGAGTTFESVRRGLKLVVVENKTLMEGHQAQLIGELSSGRHLIWCRDITELATCIDAALISNFPPFKSDSFKAHRMIRQLIESS